MKSISVHLDRLVRGLSKLPGIGPKSASRIAFYILKMRYEDVEALAQAMLGLKLNITQCSRCGGIADGEICPVCADETRDRGLLCIVQGAKDMLTIENTGGYRGLFHVLGGLISPLDGIGPEDLKIGRLVERCREESIREVILALNPTIEGDATALYIARQIQPLSIRVSRIAHGIPVGADLDFTDTATIVRSLENRTEL
ncbi:MAG: recombination protein RecR [Spirochaetes bacterium]|nr:recombination protein RecR [Spirochaetota bacterium]